MTTPSTAARLTRRERVAIALSTLLLIVCAALVLLWGFSHFRDITIQRQTTVESGSVIEGTDPKAPPVTEYNSYTRALGSHVGRIYIVYMRAEELKKSKDLPRRINWRFNVAPIRVRRHDRYKAPDWVVRLGLDWNIGGVIEGGRPNGEYWSNRSIFISVPYWMPVLASGVGGWLLGRHARLKRRRLRRGLCVACGYDIRMSPQRCPECGTVSG